MIYKQEVILNQIVMDALDSTVDCPWHSANDPLAEQPLEQIVKQVERHIILKRLKACNWNKTKTSAALGINRTQLYRKLASHGITQ